MVVKQYPHYLYAWHSTGATRAENGDFIPGRGSWTFHTMCREETNGKGEEIYTADQKAYKFAALVQMPVGTPRIPEGTCVMVSDQPLPDIEIGIADIEGSALEDSDGGSIGVPGNMHDVPNVRIYGACAKFDSGQLHCRLWL